MSRCVLNLVLSFSIEIKLCSTLYASRNFFSILLRSPNRDKPKPLIARISLNFTTEIKGYIELSINCWLATCKRFVETWEKASLFTGLDIKRAFQVTSEIFAN